MKLNLSLYVALTLLGNALSDPPGDFTATEQLEDFAPEQFEDFAMGEFESDVRQSSPSSMQGYSADQPKDTKHIPGMR